MAFTKLNIRKPTTKPVYKTTAAKTVKKSTKNAEKTTLPDAEKMRELVSPFITIDFVDNVVDIVKKVCENLGEKLDMDPVKLFYLLVEKEERDGNEEIDEIVEIEDLDDDEDDDDEDDEEMPSRTKPNHKEVEESEEVQLDDEEMPSRRREKNDRKGTSVLEECDDELELDDDGPEIEETPSEDDDETEELVEEEEIEMPARRPKNKKKTLTDDELCDYSKKLFRHMARVSAGVTNAYYTPNGEFLELDEDTEEYDISEEYRFALPSNQYDFDEIEMYMVENIDIDNVEKLAKTIKARLQRTKEKKVVKEEIETEENGEEEPAPKIPKGWTASKVNATIKKVNEARKDSSKYVNIFTFKQVAKPTSAHHVNKEKMIVTLKNKMSLAVFKYFCEVIDYVPEEEDIEEFELNEHFEDGEEFVKRAKAAKTKSKWLNYHTGGRIGKTAVNMKKYAFSAKGFAILKTKKDELWNDLCNLF